MRRSNLDDKNVGNQIRREIRSLREGFIVLMMTPAELYMSTTLTLLDYALNEERMKGVYITASRPYINLVKIFKEKGIYLDDLYFIDCISAMAGEKTGRRENCVFVQSPLELERISYYVDTLLAELAGSKRFIYLDSLSTFLIYNTSSSVGKLSHFLINKLRLQNMSGVFVSIEKEAPTELIQRLTVLCDKIVKIKQ